MNRGRAGHSHRGTANGSTRGKERQKRRAEVRSRDPRVMAAMAEVEAERAKLDALMAEQAAKPAEGVVEGALYAARRKEQERALAKAEREADKIEVPEDEIIEDVEPEEGPVIVKSKIDLRTLKQRGEDKFRFADMTARIMLKDGYNIRYVIEFTGLGYQDIKGYAELDEEGYGVIPDETDAVP